MNNNTKFLLIFLILAILIIGLGYIYIAKPFASNSLSNYFNPLGSSLTDQNRFYANDLQLATDGRYIDPNVTQINKIRYYSPDESFTDVNDILTNKFTYYYIQGTGDVNFSASCLSGYALQSIDINAQTYACISINGTDTNAVHIGDNVSDLTNDVNYQTYQDILDFNFGGGTGSVAWNGITGNQSDVSVSGFTNDVNYQTYQNVLDFNYLNGTDAFAWFQPVGSYLTSISGLNISDLVNDSNFQTYQNILDFNFATQTDLAGIVDDDSNYLSKKITTTGFLHYKMNDNTNNTDLVDSSGNSYTGTAQQNTDVLSTSGLVNSALSFNGTSDYIDTGITPSFLSGDFTINYWNYVTSGGNAYVFAGGNTTYDILIDFANTIYISSDGANWDIASAQGMGSALYDQWYMVTFVKKGNDYNVYKNGVYENGWSNASSIYSSGNNIRIGQLQQSVYNGGGQTAKMDDFRIYSSALNQTQIDTLYNSGNGTEDELSGGGGGGITDVFWDANYYRMINLKTPIDANDGANKYYVDKAITDFNATLNFGGGGGYWELDGSNNLKNNNPSGDVNVIGRLTTQGTFLVTGYAPQGDGAMFDLYGSGPIGYPEVRFFGYDYTGTHGGNYYGVNINDYIHIANNQSTAPTGQNSYISMGNYAGTDDGSGALLQVNGSVNIPNGSEYLVGGLPLSVTNYWTLDGSNNIVNNNSNGIVQIDGSTYTDASLGVSSYSGNKTYGIHSYGNNLFENFNSGYSGTYYTYLTPNSSNLLTAYAGIETQFIYQSNWNARLSTNNDYSTGFPASASFQYGSNIVNIGSYNTNNALDVIGNMDVDGTLSMSGSELYNDFLSYGILPTNAYAWKLNILAIGTEITDLSGNILALGDGGGKFIMGNVTDFTTYKTNNEYSAHIMDGLWLNPSNLPTTQIGGMYVDSGDNNLYYYNGVNWINLSGFSDTNWETSWDVFDLNMRNQYRNYSADFVDFNLLDGSPNSEGRVQWDVDNNTLKVGLNSNVSLQLGQEQFVLAKNNSGLDLTDGNVVSVVGASGTNVLFDLADADLITAHNTVGILTEPCLNNQICYITTFGVVHGLDTDSFNAGDELYLSSVAGKWVNSVPLSPAHTVRLGTVIRKNNNNGEIFVNIKVGEDLNTLDDVNASNPSNNAFLVWDSTNNVWNTVNSLDNIDSNALRSGSNISLLYNDSNYQNYSNIIDFNYVNGSDAYNDFQVKGNYLTSYTDTNWETGFTTFDANMKATYLTLNEYGKINRQGFVNLSQSTISFDGTNTFTITPTGASWQYYRMGSLFTITGAKSVVIAGSPIANGHWHIYLDSNDGTLSASLNDWGLDDAKVPVATIRFNNSMNPKYWLADERHTSLIDQRMQYYLHFTNGAKIISIPTLSGYVPNSDSNTDKTMGISSSVLLDQDLNFTLASVPDANGFSADYVTWFRVSANDWNWRYAYQLFPFTNSYIQYDLNGTLTTGQNQKFYNSYLIASNESGDSRYFIIAGRNEFSSLNSAQAENVNAFSWGTLDIDEAVILYRFTWQTNTSYTSSGKCVLASAPQPLNLTIVASASSGANITHSSLSGLNWSSAGHTADTDLNWQPYSLLGKDINGTNVNATNVYQNGVKVISSIPSYVIMDTNNISRLTNDSNFITGANSYTYFPTRADVNRWGNSLYQTISDHNSNDVPYTNFTKDMNSKPYDIYAQGLYAVDNNKYWRVNTTVVSDGQLKNGQKAYYKFSENTGYTLADSNGGLGTAYLGVTNPTWKTTGIFDNDLNFTGGTSHVDFNTTKFNLDKNFSINFWMNTPFSSGATAGRVLTNYSNSGTGWVIDCGGTNQAMRFSVGSTVVLASSGVGNTCDAGSWIMWSITFDGNSLRLYRNATFVKDASTSPITYNANDRLVAGAFFTGGSTYSQGYTGQLDEIAFWQNRVLSSSDITELYNSGTGKQYPYTSSSSVPVDFNVGIKSDSNVYVNGYVMAKGFVTLSKVATVNDGKSALSLLGNMSSWSNKDGSINYSQHYAQLGNINALDMEKRVATMEKMIWELNNNDVINFKNTSNAMDDMKTNDLNLEARIINLENQVLNLQKDTNALFLDLCKLDVSKTTSICKGTYVRPIYEPVAVLPDGTIGVVKPDKNASQ